MKIVFKPKLSKEKKGEMKKKIEDESYGINLITGKKLPDWMLEMMQEEEVVKASPAAKPKKKRPEPMKADLSKLTGAKPLAVDNLPVEKKREVPEKEIKEIKYIDRIGDMSKLQLEEYTPKALWSHYRALLKQYVALTHTNKYTRDDKDDEQIDILLSEIDRAYPYVAAMALKVDLYMVAIEKGDYEFETKDLDITNVPWEIKGIYSWYLPSQRIGREML